VAGSLKIDDSIGVSMTPGWLKRQFDSVSDEVKTWPKSLRCNAKLKINTEEMVLSEAIRLAELHGGSWALKLVAEIQRLQEQAVCH